MIRIFHSNRQCAERGLSNLLHYLLSSVLSHFGSVHSSIPLLIIERSNLRHDYAELIEKAKAKTTPMTLQMAFESNCRSTISAYLLAQIMPISFPQIIMGTTNTLRKSMMQPTYVNMPWRPTAVGQGVNAKTTTVCELAFEKRKSKGGERFLGPEQGFT